MLLTKIIDPKFPDSLKPLLSYSFPAILSMLVAALCNITDRMFIGESEGPIVLAGLALTLPFMVLLTAVGTIPGTGASLLLVKALKQKNNSQARKILGNTFTLTSGISLLLILILTIFRKEILFLFGGREQTLPPAARYLAIVVPASIFTHLSVGFSNCMRACGYARKAATIIFSGILLNLLLDYLLVRLDKINIETVAATTALSMFLCFFPIYFHFIPAIRPVHFQKSYFLPAFSTSYKIILAGMTPFFMNMTICTVSIIMNNYLVVHGGYRAIGAFGIISSYTILILTILAGFSQGMQILIREPFSYPQRDMLRKTLFLTTIVTGISLLIGEFFPSSLVHLFTTDPVWVGMTSPGIRIIFCTLPILGFQFITAGYFQSIDKTRKALFLNMSRQFLFLIPSLFLFADMWGLTGIWCAIPFSDFMVTILASFFLFIEKENKHKSASVAGDTGRN